MRILLIPRRMASLLSALIMAIMVLLVLLFIRIMMLSLTFPGERRCYLITSEAELCFTRALQCRY
jgi:hypothetical protein